MEKDWKAYCTCCGGPQQVEYNYKDTDHIKFIDIFKDLPLQNINHLNHHYSQIICMYYVWKNQLKSDYICIWDHRRYFTPINFDELDKDKIQVYFSVETELTPFEYMIKEGMNEYIIYQFIKFMIERYKIDHDRIIDLIFNKSWNNRLWLITGFNCNWKVFNDLCNFTFDFVDYVIPNGDHTNNASIETWVQDMKRSVCLFRTKFAKEGSIIESGRIESEDRDIGNITECLYPLFCEFMGYEWFMEVDDKHLVLELSEFNKDTIFSQISKWVHKNVFTGCRKFYIVVPEQHYDTLSNIILGSDWYSIYHACPEIHKKKDFYKDHTIDNKTWIKLNIDEYIDSDSPTDTMDINKIKKFENGAFN